VGDRHVGAFDCYKPLLVYDPVLLFCTGVFEILLKLTYEQLHDDHLGVTWLVLRICERRISQMRLPSEVKAIKTQLNKCLKLVKELHLVELDV